MAANVDQSEQDSQSGTVKVFITLVLLWLLSGGVAWLIIRQWYIPAVGILLLIFSALILIGYTTNWFPWINIKSRKLWGWMKLLIIPLVLSTAAIGFGWQQNNANLMFSEQQATIAMQQRQTDISNADKQRQTDISNADNQRLDDILQTYQDYITGLVTTGNLRNSNQLGMDLRALAQARTLITLRLLDGERKALVLRFLPSANFINRTPAPVVNLAGGDLSNADLKDFGPGGADLAFVILSEANLNGADLSGDFLPGAILSDAQLMGVNLIGAQLYNYNLRSNKPNEVADLSNANLRNAQLMEADLIQVNLHNADLTGANLTGADLTNANLCGAKGITDQQLQRAKSVNGLIWPDCTKHS